MKLAVECDLFQVPKSVSDLSDILNNMFKIRAMTHKLPWMIKDAANYFFLVN